MDTFDFFENAKCFEIREEMKEAIFEDIKSKGLFGRMNLWQDIMKRDLQHKYPKSQWEQFDIAVDELMNDGIIRMADHGHYAITKEGEEIIYSNDYYLVETVIDKIILYFNEKGYAKGYEWPFIDAMLFCDKDLTFMKKDFSAHR